MIKKIFYLILIIVIGSLVTDYVLTMRLDKEAWFIFKKEENINYGLIYKIKYKEDKKEFYIFDFKVDKMEIESQKTVEIIDKTGDTCLEEKYYFYENDEYKYFFPCQKELYIKIGTVEYSLKNALENNLITIEELEKKNVIFKKEVK